VPLQKANSLTGAPIETTVEFTRDAGGKIIGLKVEQNGTHEWKKIE
jgi:hypothetical protein